MTPRETFDELRRATVGALADYSGITYERIDREEGIFWPCPSETHPGTPRLFAGQFPTPSGRARFHTTPLQQDADPRDSEYPMLLTTGRLLAQYQSGTQTRRVDALVDAAPAPFAELHPTTAARLGVADGDQVMLSTRRGEAAFAAKLTRAIREDTVFVPFHWGGDQAINRLTSPALDPISRMPQFKVCAVRANAVARAQS